MENDEKKSPLGRPTKYKPEYCEMLIKHMSEGRSLYTFGAVINVNEDTIAEWVKVYPAFSEAKRQGRIKEIAWWEEILRAGAAGKIPGYNATSVIFALKNKSPRHWRDKHEIVSTINVNQAPLSPKEVKQILIEDKFVDVIDITPDEENE